VGICLPEATPCNMGELNGAVLDASKSNGDIRKFFKASNKENDNTGVTVTTEKYIPL